MTDAADEALTEAGVLARIRPGRAITGMSAVLLPFTSDGEIDWDATEAHIGRTVDAGLTPAVNMDTGYVQLLTDAQKSEVLDRAASTSPAAGSSPGPTSPTGRATRSTSTATSPPVRPSLPRGGTPVIFPSSRTQLARR